MPLPEPCDVLHISPAARPGLSISCSSPDILPGHNTLTRAYELYAQASSYAPALSIRLEKGIPAGSGLGGGSSDAATLLLYLNAQAPRALAPDLLAQVAASTGADVPFFLQKSICRVRGIGDILEPCSTSLAHMQLVLLCPEISVSSAWAYKVWDASPAALALSAQERLTNAKLEAKEMNFCAHGLQNDLETVVFAAWPKLKELKLELLQQGAEAAVMSGSGASLVGLFADPKKARDVAVFFGAQGLRVYCRPLVAQADGTNSAFCPCGTNTGV